MIRLFFDLCFYFCREFQKSGPTEENWWIKCTMDPPSFGIESKVGAAMVGSALICKKKIRFNLLKISSKFAGHEMMRCHIYSPTNLAYMSRWMAKIQIKQRRKQNCKKERSLQGEDVQGKRVKASTLKWGPHAFKNCTSNLKFRFELILNPSGTQERELHEIRTILFLLGLWANP